MERLVVVDKFMWINYHYDAKKDEGVGMVGHQTHIR